MSRALVGSADDGEPRHPRGAAGGRRDVNAREGGGNNGRDRDRKTVLMKVVSSDYADTARVRLLLEHGVDVNARSSRMAPRREARKKGASEIVAAARRCGREGVVRCVTFTWLSAWAARLAPRRTRGRGRKSRGRRGRHGRPHVAVSKRAAVAAENRPCVLEWLRLRVLPQQHRAGHGPSRWRATTAFSIDEKLASESLKQTLDFIELRRERIMEGLSPGGGQGEHGEFRCSSRWRWPRCPATNRSEASARYLRVLQSPGRSLAGAEPSPADGASSISSTAMATIGSAPTRRSPAARNTRPTSPRRALARRREARRHRRLRIQDHRARRSAPGSRAVIDSMARELAALQRPDGGWAQLAGLETDSYATGRRLTCCELRASAPPTSATAAAWRASSARSTRTGRGT